MLRELRADLLPGRSFWTSELASPAPATGTGTPATGAGAGAGSGPSKPVAPSTSTAKAPKGAASASGSASASSAAATVSSSKDCAKDGSAVATTKAAANPSTMLKRLCLRGERGLVVELLKDCQARVRPPAGAFRVWVQELLNPGAKEVRLRYLLALFT